MKPQDKLIIFQDKEIRRIWHNEQWFFSVVDVDGVLTNSSDAKDYWYRLKERENLNTEFKYNLSTVEITSTRWETKAHRLCKHQVTFTNNPIHPK